MTAHRRRPPPGTVCPAASACLLCTARCGRPPPCTGNPRRKSGGKPVSPPSAAPRPRGQSSPHRYAGAVPPPAPACHAAGRRARSAPRWRTEYTPRRSSSVPRSPGQRPARKQSDPPSRTRCPPPRRTDGTGCSWQYPSRRSRTSCRCARSAPRRNTPGRTAWRLVCPPWRGNPRIFHLPFSGKFPEPEPASPGGSPLPPVFHRRMCPPSALPVPVRRP